MVGMGSVRGAGVVRLGLEVAHGRRQEGNRHRARLRNNANALVTRNRAAAKAGLDMVAAGEVVVEHG